eukprot:scaffold1982_cov115-Isochrysis_galbana.AAC.5
MGVASDVAGDQSELAGRKRPAHVPQLCPCATLPLRKGTLEGHVGRALRSGGSRMDSLAMGLPLVSKDAPARALAPHSPCSMYP